MHCAGFIVSLLLTTAPPSTGPATMPSHDPLAESRRINEQIARLTAETPVARQMEELRSKADEHSREVHRQMQEIHKSPEWREYQRRLAELQSSREGSRQAELKALAEAGRKLYAERHAELRERARVELVEGRRLGLDVLTYPRIDGSTSTHPLSVIAASRLLSIPYEWHYREPQGWFVPISSEQVNLFLPEDPSRDPQAWHREDLELRLADCRAYARPEGNDPRQERVARMINSLLAAHTGTHTAHVNLIAGRCDLILVAREPSESELKLAREAGVTLVTTPIANDALVFIVNRQNGVTDLSQAQLRQIYEGKIARWSEVGGSDAPIVPLRREPDSGSRELFDELLMRGDPLPDPPEPYTLEMFETRDMSGPYNRITRVPAALGYSVYYYERYMAMSPQTRTIAIDGIEPTPETIASAQYPFVAAVYAVHRAGEPADSNAMRLLRWLLSAEGQAVVRESGYVPVGDQN